MEVNKDFALESKESFRESIDAHWEGCLLYDAVEYTLSDANNGVNRFMMAQVKKLDETEMFVDSLDELFDGYVMHDGKYFGDVVQFTEYN